MTPQLRFRRTLAAVAAVLGTLVPAWTAAQTSQVDAGGGNWRYGATVYGYLPSVGGSTSTPTGGGGIPINVDVDKILDSLQFTLMGTFDAHNGRWGVFTDLIY